MIIKGLTSSEVEESRKLNGDNVIPDSEPTTFWAEFKETFSDPMIRILVIIAIIMSAMAIFGYAEFFEPAGTVVAILVVAFVSAKTAVASDTKYRDIKASVKKDVVKTYRNGKVEEVVIDDLVAGDFIILQSGDKVPADGVMFDGTIKVDNSALNGETEDCKKYADADAVFPTEITGDSFVDKTSVFRGAVVTDGEAVIHIEHVGMKTMMGKMAEEMQQEEPDSPLRVKLDKLAHQISVFGYIGAVVIAVLMMAYNIYTAGGIAQYAAKAAPDIIQDVVNAVSLAVVIIVCAVPEGLPLMISLVLMQNTSKMLDHNVLVRKAVGIETAGSLNILFSDKTGTITKGQLTVVEYFDGLGESYSIQSKVPNYGPLLTSIARNTQAMFDGEHKVVGGNFTDKALLNFIGEEAFNGAVNDGVEVTNSQSFNSANKFSQVELNGRTYYKGAPEKLLLHAKKCLDKSGKVVNITKDAIDKKSNELAEKSMRLLAFGYSEESMTENEINDDLVIIGFVGIRDDVRPDAVEAIKRIHDAGVQLVMITGDRVETARAIAKDAGLIKSDDDLCLTSAELNKMSDEEVKEKIPHIRVIARALPTDKSRMVRLSQELNLVAGMTGDGVNDSPALKLADVGFAMGSGTDVAKEASKIVILDDSLTSIADAIWYGRTIYHNILKFCNFQLVINVCAVVVSAIAPFFGVEEPLKVTHLLFVNLVMDSLGAIMLGNEPAREKYMYEKPRRRDEAIISPSMGIRILYEAAWMIFMSFLILKLPFFADNFETPEKLLTAYFVFFIVSALWNGFNVRDEKFGIFTGLNENPGFLKVFIAIVAIQAVIVYAGMIPGLDFIGKMFSCTPLTLLMYLEVIGIAFLIVPVDCVRKLFVKAD